MPLLKRNYKRFAVILCLSLFVIFTVKAQEIAPKIGIYGCKLDENVYWTIDGTYASHVSDGVMYYHFKPVETGEYSAWIKCWPLFSYNEEPLITCTVNGVKGYRGLFNMGTVFDCTIDHDYLFLALGTLLSLAYLKINRLL